MQPGAPPPLVLLVEDSEDLRETLEAFLQSRGYRVVACEDLQGAIAALRAERPDLVVTDIFLGNSSGLDLITKIRSDFVTPPPVIACSGMPDIEPAARARGADLFLLKPLDGDTFVQAIAALLASHGPSHEILEEHVKRSLALRARQIEAAREAMARLEPHRPFLARLAERDARWLRAFLGFGNVITTVIDGDHARVAASSDPRRWPVNCNVENDLPLVRHILETGSTFVVPDVASLLPLSVTAQVKSRFMAGFPIANGDVPIGAVCLVDDQPQRLDPADFALLEDVCGHLSDLVSGDRPLVRETLLMKLPALETVMRTEFDRAARLGLTIHLFSFLSRTPPADWLAERSLVAEIGADRFGMILTRGSRDRSPPDLVAAVQRMAALPGFGGGDLVSIEVSAVPRLDEGYVIRLAERRLDERAEAKGPPTIDRIVVHREALDHVAGHALPFTRRASANGP